MENPNPAPKSPLNLTVIAVVALALLAGLGALYILSQRGGSQAGGGGLTLSKPNLPLVLTWRETLGFGKTQVAVIHGKNDVPLGLIIEVTRSVDGKTMRMQATLEPKGLLEVGSLQCPDSNNFVPGDRISIRNINYASYDEACPR
jgi:hypothetical protein